MSSPSPVSPLELAGTALYLAAFPALMLLLAGDWRWREGWIFGGWLVGISGFTVGWLHKKDPALLAARYRRPGSGGQSFHDQAIVYVIAIWCACRRSASSASCRRASTASCATPCTSARS